MKQLYIIAGCNGAGKTTVSYSILPDILNCKEFVNADEIAKGLSPFQPESTSIEAGRLMLKRIKKLLDRGENFALETTLSTRTYVNFIKKAKEKGYSVSLLFFWLNSTELALQRVKTRVSEGGHNIPRDVIIRRYENGLSNFFNLYKNIVSDWMFVDNSGKPYKMIANSSEFKETILEQYIWKKLKDSYGK